MAPREARKAVVERIILTDGSSELDTAAEYLKLSLEEAWERQESHCHPSWASFFFLYAKQVQKKSNGDRPQPPNPVSEIEGFVPL